MCCLRCRFSITIWIFSVILCHEGLRVKSQYQNDPALECRKDVLVATYKFITPIFGSYQCMWTVSLDELSMTRSDARLQFSLTNWTSIDQNILGDASLFFYDISTNSVITEFHRRPFYSGDLFLNRVYNSSGPGIRIKYQSNSKYFFNVTVKARGVCLPGTSPCGDGITCYKPEETCDGNMHCSTGYDELGCPGCKATEFSCGEQHGVTECFTSTERCDGTNKCNRDEENCQTCAHGAIRCKTSNKCVFESWWCDSDNDCPDGSDEEDCTYPASRRVITAAIVGALVCSLLLVISMGCTCKLYSLRTAHHRRITLHSTPLSRLEQEIFARQAPPTYDMTVSGIDHDAISTRHHRNRRRRNRRYPFRRTAPARNESQANDSRQEGVQSNAPQQQTLLSISRNNQTPSTGQNQPTTSENESQQCRQGRSSTLHNLGSFLFESMRPNGTPATPSPPGNSGTQENRNPVSRSGTSNSNSTETATRSTTRSARASRTSSRGRPTSGSQQAQPLPKKKRILPVRIPAPIQSVTVEENTMACLYPSPPSYTQAVLSDHPFVTNEDHSPIGNEYAEESSRSANGDSSVVVNDERTPENLTTVTKSSFSFSWRHAFRKLHSSLVQRLMPNPYLQMNTDDSRRNSRQGSLDETSDDGQSFMNSCSSQSLILPQALMQTRGSTSSDDDLINCLQSSANDGVNQCNAGEPVSEVQSTSSRKIFPTRRPRKNVDDDCDSINMFDLSGERK